MSIYFSGSNTPTSGAAGQGVPTGGANGQVLKKNSSTDYDTSWAVLSSSYISDFATTVLATLLTGLSLATSTPVTSADTILVAIGKLQAQVTLRIGLYFTEGINSSTPNATIPVVTLTATNAASSVDVGLIVKGNGAIVVQIPDNGTTGGNKRGTNAIDLQMARNANTQVGSGANSFVAGGINNTGSGNQSFVTGGANVASGGFSAVFGSFNTGNGINSFCGGGTSNTASGAHSSVFGVFANAFTSYARMVLSANRFATSGDSQRSFWKAQIATTDATPTVMTIDGGAAGANTRIALQNNNTFAFTGLVVGKKTGSTDAAAWKIEGMITRGANAAATTLVANTVTAISNAPAWGGVALSADTTNGALIITVTGLAATNIRWSANLDTAEIIYV